MKKYLFFMLVFVLIFSSCSGNISNSSAPESDITDSESHDESHDETLDESRDFMADAKKVISSLDYKNQGKMGDVDGPAFAVYSQKGYSGASVKLDVDGMEIKTVLPNGNYINAYAFLGIDVYSSYGWINCVDAGLCWSGVNGGWHLFYNMYEPLNSSTPTWYESRKKLPKNDTYKMTLEITRENYAKLTVVGERTGAKDSVELEVKGARADGSNTSFLFNAALDYPPNTKIDGNGNPCEDWVEITLANSDKGLCFRSCHVFDLSLYNGETASPWTNDKTQAVSIWPDKKVSGFDYSPTRVGISDGTEFWIDFNMNR